MKEQMKSEKIKEEVEKVWKELKNEQTTNEVDELVITIEKKNNIMTVKKAMEELAEYENIKVSGILNYNFSVLIPEEKKQIIDTIYEEGMYSDVISYKDNVSVYFKDIDMQEVLKKTKELVDIYNDLKGPISLDLTFAGLEKHNIQKIIKLADNLNLSAELSDIAKKKNYLLTI